MKFFVPNVKYESKTEEAWQRLRQLASREGDDNWSPNERRIFKICYRHNAQSWVAEVGKPHPENRQAEVYASFDTPGPCYIVCTYCQGVFRGPFVGKGDTTSVEDFE
jgi:hypothetical protein